MPIEIAYTPSGWNQEIGNYLIEPGEGLIMHNLVNEEEEVLAIGCSVDDKGGEVKIMPAEGAIAEVAKGLVMPSDMPEPREVVKVAADKPYERSLLDQDGNTGTLKVRHVSALAITASGLIPRSLKNPN